MNILITGASRGLGAATARKFASLPGSELFLVSRNKKSLNQLKKSIIKDYPEAKISVFGVDLEMENNIKDFISEIRKKTDHLDAIINNAGQLINKKFSETGSEEIRKIFAVNYTAPALIIRECTDLLKKAGKAHIVNISSMGGFQGSVKFPGLSHYSSSKAAIAALTECLAVEFEGEISVNCLAIGSVQTEMLEEAFPGYKAPLQPEEMANFIYEFTLNAHKFMNGKIIPVSLANP